MEDVTDCVVNLEQGVKLVIPGEKIAGRHEQAEMRVYDLNLMSMQSIVKYGLIQTYENYKARQLASE